MGIKNWLNELGFGVRERLRKMMRCICSGEHVRDDMIPSSESLATRDYSAGGYSSIAGEPETKVDNSNIEEAESSLRESGYLNYEEARALLGRLEYQKGNIEAALRVFEGIDVAAVTPKMKVSISRISEQNRRHSQSDAAPPMSMHAVNLLLEAVFLESKSLQILGRFKESAQLCKIILDVVESALPGGLQETFATDYKLQDTLNGAVKLLPELWKLAGAPQEAILSYRRALLYQWNLDITTISKIEKEFATFLLYSGNDASPPTLGSQIEGSFVPRNNIEEAIILLLLLLSKFVVGAVGWDPSVLDHLSFALCVSGELGTLAHEVEKLLPGIMGREERNYMLALCHYAKEEDIVALNLLRNILNKKENIDCIQELLLAKICGENMVCISEGIFYVQKALSNGDGRCGQMISTAYCLLGVLLSSQYKFVVSDSERLLRQSEALETLEFAKKTMLEQDPYIMFHLCLENADQRKLDVALHYAKQLLKVEAGSSVRSYTLLARIMSAQKQFFDAVTVINAALDQTEKWEQVELLRTKAKLQIAQGYFLNAIKTYINLLAVLKVQSKSVGIEKRLLKQKKGSHNRNLEMETWHDLANLYTTLSQWRDAEICLSKSKAISPYSASRWHSTGIMYKAKGLNREALQSFRKALDVDPTHVPSLVSSAGVLLQLDGQAVPIARSLLNDALRLDRMNPTAWYNLGMAYKGNAGASSIEAAECFEAAALLEESTPVEPFR